MPGDDSAACWTIGTTRNVEDAFTPGQAARTTVVLDSDLIAAPPRICQRWQIRGGAATRVVCDNKRYSRRLPRREGT